MKRQALTQVFPDTLAPPTTKDFSLESADLGPAELVRYERGIDAANRAPARRLVAENMTWKLCGVAPKHCKASTHVVDRLLHITNHYT